MQCNGMFLCQVFLQFCKDVYKRQEEDKKPFKVFYFAQIFEKLSVKFTDSFYFKDCDNEGDKLFEVATLKFSKV